MKKIDKNIEENIIKEYLNGNSCNKIAKIFNVSSTTVFASLKRNNIELRTKGGIYKLPKDKIADLYKNGVKVTEIAKEYNVNIRTIYNCLNDINVNLDYRYINQSLDIHYFDCIDTYDKAYFIGMLITDGCVLDNNSISISLKADDYEILEILNAKISNENSLYFSKRNEATLHFKNKYIKETLAKYNIVPRKTFTVDFLELNKTLMPHLIRGMIDGDGWISYKSRAIGFCGNEKCVTHFRDFLAKELDIYNVKVIHSEENLYQVSWSSKKDITKIGNYIYSDKKDCYLKRKYENFMVIPR